MDLHKGTQLNGRFLWYDGNSTIGTEQLNRIITIGLPTKGICVGEISKDVKQFNSLVESVDQIKTKSDLDELNKDWNIPTEYSQLDIQQYLVDRLIDEVDNTTLSENEITQRSYRIVHELSLYTQLGLFDVLRTLIFVINKLYENDVVWGVGRGSSVASYVLYLIGVHDVDSVMYDLDVTEFLR